MVQPMATGAEQHPILAKKSALRDLPNEDRNIILTSPGNCPLSKSNNGMNGHVVYVRRKPDTEPAKVNSNMTNCNKKTVSEKFDDIDCDSPTMKRSRIDYANDSIKQVDASPLKVAINNERFGQLQMFLKACDQSNLEDYIQRLRSYSPASRSKLAYELEKRAIKLTLEEGKELHRVRALNVLGKGLPDQHVNS